MGYAYFVQTHWDSQLNCIEMNRYRSFADSWWCWSVHSHVNAIRNTFTAYYCVIAISFVSSSIDLTFWKGGGGGVGDPNWIDIHDVFMHWATSKYVFKCHNGIACRHNHSNMAPALLATPSFCFWMVCFTPRLTNTIEQIMKLEMCPKQLCSIHQTRAI